MAMLEMPMLYDSLEHAHRAMNGETFKPIKQGLSREIGSDHAQRFPPWFSSLLYQEGDQKCRGFRGLAFLDHQPRGNNAVVSADSELYLLTLEKFN